MNITLIVAGNPTFVSATIPGITSTIVMSPQNPEGFDSIDVPLIWDKAMRDPSDKIIVYFEERSMLLQLLPQLAFTLSGINYKTVIIVLGVSSVLNGYMLERINRSAAEISHLHSGCYLVMSTDEIKRWDSFPQYQIPRSPLAVMCRRCGSSHVYFNGSGFDCMCCKSIDPFLLERACVLMP